MTVPLLEVRNLRTYFDTDTGTYRAVDGVDLTLEAGRTLCVVGESGSGKSVTALSIMGLVDSPGRIMPDAMVRFDGRDLLPMSERKLRALRGRDLAMVFQEPMSALDPLYRVGSQIVEALRSHRKVGADAARERAIELMDLVGIPEPERRVDAYPHELSGGMQQRVVIAIALCCDPKLLIADEPTTALDVTIQAQILELLRDLRDRLGMAILLITHDLGVVAEMADDVAVMYAGRVVERGQVQDVFARPQHPYTRALLHAVPVLGMDRTRELPTIPGVVPSAAAWPKGCRFADRCDVAFERCHEEYPPTFVVDRQDVACWLAQDELRADHQSSKEAVT